MEIHPTRLAVVAAGAALLCAMGGGLASAQRARGVGTTTFHAPVGSDRASGVRTTGVPTTLRQTAPADLLVLPAAQLAAVDELTETFDDITLLPGAGWALTNNSTPPGPVSWFQGNQTVLPAHEGAPNAYIAANYESAGDAGTISNWLITPEVTIGNGTELRFWTRKAPQFEAFFDRLEVRLSVAGASVDVGAAADSVGDFTDLLLTINENLAPGQYPEEWTEYVVTVRGRSRAPVTGRFAFRYWVPDTASNGDYIGIDTVRLTQQPASAHQFPTSLTSAGTGGAIGDTRTLTFGGSGVTLTETNTAVTLGGSTNADCSMWGGLGGVDSTGTVSTFTEPDQPANAFGTANGCFEGMRTSTLTLSKPLIAPILHLNNLDGSTLAWSGTSTTGAAMETTTIVKNNQMEVTENLFNSTVEGAINGGCSSDASPPENPNGGCGSFRLTAASGFIQSLTFTNSEEISGGTGGDGWGWTLSFPTTPLTTAFSPNTIAEGNNSELTFSIINPAGSAAVPLSPLDFTETLPAGVILASASLTDNDQCGDSLTVTDGAGGTIDVGDTSIRLGGITLAVGATCTISVSVTAPQGSYANDASKLSSDVGNVVPTGAALLTVTPPGGGGGSATITHSTSLDMQEGRGPACRPYFDDSTATAQYLRTFTLTDFGITGAFTVTEVTFGVELATYPWNSPTVNLYTLDGDLTYDNLTLIGSAFANFGLEQSQLVTVPVTGTAPAGSTLVVEIAARDLMFVGRFLPGANDLGETAPSYFAADACGVPNPITFGDYGFPSSDLVMTVTGETAAGAPLTIRTHPARTSLDRPGGSVSERDRLRLGVRPRGH